MATTWHVPERLSTESERVFARLLHLVTERDRVERQIAVTAAEARAVGCTWEAIGSALGLTKQGAYFRFGRDDQA